MSGTASGGFSIIFFNYFSLCLLLGLCLPLFTSMYTLFTYCLLSLWLTVPLHSFQRRISTTFIFLCLLLFISLQLFTIVYTLIIYCLLSIYLAVLQLAFLLSSSTFSLCLLPCCCYLLFALFPPCLSIVESRWLAQSFILCFNDLLFPFSCFSAIVYCCLHLVYLLLTLSTADPVLLFAFQLLIYTIFSFVCCCLLLRYCILFTLTWFIFCLPSLWLVQCFCLLFGDFSLLLFFFFAFVAPWLLFTFVYTSIIFCLISLRLVQCFSLLFCYFFLLFLALFCLPIAIVYTF